MLGVGKGSKYDTAKASVVDDDEEQTVDYGDEYDVEYLPEEEDVKDSNTQMNLLGDLINLDSELYKEEETKNNYEDTRE